MRNDSTNLGTDCLKPIRRVNRQRNGALESRNHARNSVANMQLLRPQLRRFADNPR